jgi:hypothetical protein
MLLLNEFHLKYFSYGSALVSALVLSKIILLERIRISGSKI